MFRLYDWGCDDCNYLHEPLIDVPVGGAVPLVAYFYCPLCEETTKHERELSLPAPYMGERVCNPCVRGGSFDTMGNSPVPSLPELPSSAEGTCDDYRAHFDSKEWRESRKERNSVTKQNQEKRKRAAAIQSGAPINMRRDKCAGDPNIMA